MHDEIYADGVGEVTVTGNVVRIDMVSLSPAQKDANNRPSAVFRQRVIMPIEAFANTAELLNKVLAGLVESGAIKLRSPAPPALGPAPTMSEVTVRKGSPNFQ